MGLTLSRRIDNVLRNIHFEANNVDEMNALVDCLISAFLLPKLELNRNDDAAHFEKISRLKTSGSYPMTAKILELMSDADEINYWRQ